MISQDTTGSPWRCRDRSSTSHRQRPHEGIRQLRGGHPVQRFVHADEEPVAIRRAQHNTLGGEVRLDRRGVAGFHTQAEQVRAGRNTFDCDALDTLETANEILGS
jgi:hypothetical protein